MKPAPVVGVVVLLCLLLGWALVGWWIPRPVLPVLAFAFAALAWRTWRRRPWAKINI